MPPTACASRRRNWCRRWPPSSWRARPAVNWWPCVEKDKARSYRHYLAARFLGLLGNNMLAVALGWQMYELTASAWDLGLVGLAQFLPALLLTVPAGLLVDSHDRRLVFATSLALQGAAAVLLCWGSTAGWVERDAILLVCLVTGVGRSLQLPAQQAIVPALVARTELPRALAQNASLTKISTIAGPALGGFLYAGGAGFVYGLCAGVFALGTALALQVRLAPLARSAEPLSWTALFAGIAFIRTNPLVLGAMSLDLFATLAGTSMALLPMFAKDILHTGAWGLGLLRAAPAVGGLLVSAWISRRPMDQQVGRRMYAAVLVYGSATIAFSVCTDLAWAMAALAVVGAADIVSTVLRHSVVQVETADALRGRVGAAHATSIAASNQLGQFRAGVVAEWLGPATAVLMGGCATVLVVAAWTRLFPALYRRSALFSEQGV
nr:MFS transporter [Massilia sp. IC2-477]